MPEGLQPIPCRGHHMLCKLLYNLALKWPICHKHLSFPPFRHAKKHVAPVQQHNATLTPSGLTDRIYVEGARASGSPATAPSASNTSSNRLPNGPLPSDALRPVVAPSALCNYICRCNNGIWIQHIWWFQSSIVLMEFVVSSGNFEM